MIKTLIGLFCFIFILLVAIILGTFAIIFYLSTEYFCQGETEVLINGPPSLRKDRGRLKIVDPLTVIYFNLSYAKVYFASRNIRMFEMRKVTASNTPFIIYTGSEQWSQNYSYYILFDRATKDIEVSETNLKNGEIRRFRGECDLARD